MAERLAFESELIWWRGPAPFYFFAVPEPQRSALHELAHEVTYGWGMIPSIVSIGRSTWETSLFPKDGGYLVPVRKLFRVRENLEEGERYAVELEVGKA